MTVPTFTAGFDIQRAKARKAHIYAAIAFSGRARARQRTVGAASGPSAAVVIAADDLVARLAGDAELAAQRRDRLTIQNPRNEFKTLVHAVALLPRHLRSPRKGKKCNPSLRYQMSPFSREGHQSVTL